MNVKINISDIIYVPSATTSLAQLAQAIAPYAQKARLIMPAPEIGSGYAIWRLSGDGWTSFGSLPDDKKPEIAEMFMNRISAMKEAMGGNKLAEDVTQVPSTDFLYMRSNGSDYELALTGWAHRYPDKRHGDELETYINRVAKQETSLGFSWNGSLMPNQQFRINNLSHSTPQNGLFHVGNLPVDSSYYIYHIGTGNSYNLIVEKDKDQYIYDLTQYFTCQANVTCDDIPQANQNVSVSFDGSHYDLVTDQCGNASVKIALAPDADGKPMDPQPECTATYDGETQRMQPQGKDDMVKFVFAKKTPPSPAKEPSEPEKKDPEFVTIHLSDYGLVPMPNLPFTLHTKTRKDLKCMTDANGDCKVPKEYFTDKSKFKIVFTITPEYRESHERLHEDMADDKKNNKKK